MLNSLDPDQARHFVGPGLGPNCLQRLSADDNSRQRVKVQAMCMSSSVYLSRYLQHKLKVGMCIQLRFKSVCTSALSDQSLNFPPGETLNPWLPIEHPSKTSDQTAWMHRLI